MTTFDVEVVLKNRDFAVKESVAVPHGPAATWDEAAVFDALVELLRALGGVLDPVGAGVRPVILTGFSWIVEPLKDDVILAIEIPMGAAVAGPFRMPQARLDALVTNVLRMERQRQAPTTVH